MFLSPLAISLIERDTEKLLNLILFLIPDTWINKYKVMSVHRHRKIISILTSTLDEGWTILSFKLINVKCLVSEDFI